MIISALEISNIGKKVLSADKSERRKIAQEIQGKYNILIVSFPEIKGDIRKMYQKVRACDFCWCRFE